jgi:hypothetical protein
MATNRTADAVAAEPHCFREKFRCIPHSFKMGLSQFVQVSLVACALCASSSTVQAQTSYYQFINAASCSFNPNMELIFVLDHSINGVEGQTAYCQLTMSSDWPVENLSFVAISGAAAFPGRRIIVSLCVNNGRGEVTSDVICGDQSTISGSGEAFVLPPKTLPVAASGAFVKIIFPSDPGGASRVFQLMPFWEK